MKQHNVGKVKGRMEKWALCIWLQELQDISAERYAARLCRAGKKPGRLYCPKAARALHSCMDYTALEEGAQHVPSFTNVEIGEGAWPARRSQRNTCPTLWITCSNRKSTMPISPQPAETIKAAGNPFIRLKAKQTDYSALFPVKW